MQSKNVFIFALLTGAGAFIIALGGLLTLEFLDAAEPYLTGRTKAVNAKINASIAPNLITKLDGSNVRIVELDKHGVEVRTIYSSDLHDATADFSLFAVPQTTYQGVVYVRSIDETDSQTLIVYPLSVETGQLSPAVLNLPSASASLSTNQTMVAVVAKTKQQVTAYHLPSGRLLASWTLADNERLESETAWISAGCFEATITQGVEQSSRLFCVESTVL